MLKTIEFKEIDLYLDNFFTNISLFVYLLDKMKVHATGTFRKNRIEKCPLKTDKQLKSDGRGSLDFKSFENKFIMIKFFDNEAVHIGSTIYGVEPKGKLLRYSVDHENKINIKCPNAISQYNLNMGGVDKSNYLVSLYRLRYKSRRWYMPIFYYLIDVCISNAWILYLKNNNSIKQKNF